MWFTGAWFRRDGVKGVVWEEGRRGNSDCLVSFVEQPIQALNCVETYVKCITLLKIIPFSKNEITLNKWTPIPVN